MTEKIAFFDMDGTLLGNYDYDENKGNTSWSQLASSIDEETLRQKKEINQQWYEGEIETYPDWVDKTLDLYKDKGLTEKTFDRIINEADYNDGVKQGFKILNQHDVRTVILTGGFRKSARRIKTDLDINHFVAACEVLWDEDGIIDGNNVIPLDRSGKKNMMDMYINSYANDEKVLTSYTGDGMNDLLAIQNADLGITYNGRDKLEEAADYSYTSEDGFIEVIERILSFFEETDRY